MVWIYINTMAVQSRGLIIKLKQTRVQYIYLSIYINIYLCFQQSTNLSIYLMSFCQTIYRESQTIWDLVKTTLGLLADIFERMQGFFVRTNIWKIFGMLFGNLLNPLIRPSLFIWVQIGSKDIGKSHVFWGSLYLWTYVNIYLYIKLSKYIVYFEHCIYLLSKVRVYARGINGS